MISDLVVDSPKSAHILGIDLWNKEPQFNEHLYYQCINGFENHGIKIGSVVLQGTYDLGKTEDIELFKDTYNWFFENYKGLSADEKERNEFLLSYLEILFHHVNNTYSDISSKYFESVASTQTLNSYFYNFQNILILTPESLKYFCNKQKIKNLIIVGSAWKECIHHRPIGLDFLSTSNLNVYLITDLIWTKNEGVLSEQHIEDDHLLYHRCDTPGIYKLANKEIKMKKVNYIRQRENVLQLTWVLNNICTNQCDYCPPTLHSGTNHHYNWTHANTFVDRLFTRYPKIHCSISGGEPTVSPFFIELVKKFYNAGHTVGITTNGARNTRYWEEISSYFSYICFSYHPQFHDEALIEKALAASKFTNVTIRIMMDTRYWDLSVAMYEKASKIPQFRTESVRILSEMADRHIGNEYSVDQLKWIHNNSSVLPTITPGQNNIFGDIRKSSTGASFYYNDGTYDAHGDTNKLISEGQTDFRGWACNIGIESLFIHFDGWIKKGNCLQGGNLFHLDKHYEYELPNNGELCVQGICHCGTDVNITKFPLYEKTHPLVVNNSEIKYIKTTQEYNDSYKGLLGKSRVIKIEPKNV